MQAAVYRALRPFWRGGEETRRHRKELAATQWFSKQELEEWQLERLRALVRYAYAHVPFYRRLYRSLDIHPGDIRSIPDFRRLPFLTREDVNTHLDELVSPEFKGLVRLDSTGGSTGEPMRFYIDDSYHWWDAALEFRGREWYGVREGDKIAWVWGAERDMDVLGWKDRLKARIQQNRYLNAFGMTRAKMEAFAGMLVCWKPDMFRAYPAALSLLAAFLKEQGIGGIRPRLIEATAEKAAAPQRELMEEVFQCRVADWYSAREFGTIGFQCPSGGLHVCETRYLEVVAGGCVVPPGRMGEVAVTSLHQLAMPFIRYKIGDMAVFEEEACACGRGMPVLREIAGRTDAFVVTPDGQFVHGGFFPHTFRHWPEIFRYQIYQPGRGRLEVRLVCRSDAGSSWLEEVRAALRARFGPRMKITFDIVDEIELTPAGKHRYIISDVKPDFS